MTNFKTKFCWWPVRLARSLPVTTNPYESSMEWIGWVWLQEAHLTRNVNHGWVCFLDSKPQPKRCTKCQQLLS